MAQPDQPGKKTIRRPGEVKLRSGAGADREKGAQGSAESMFSACGGIGAALKAVAGSPTWRFQGGQFPYSQESCRKDSPGLSDDDEDEERNEPETIEDVGPSQVNFESKYLQRLPLYQEYWLKALRADVHRVHHSGLAELVAPRCLPGLLAHQTPKIHSAAPRHLTEGVTCSLWQELPEVQERGLLQTLSGKEVRLQETMFELMASEASYLKSLSVAVNLFLTSKQLRKALTTVEHHILFSNLREVCRVSERFLLDLEVRLGESMVMSQVGDIVLRHRTELRQAYVPYVTNMMYQEALINQLMQHNQKFVLYLRKLEKDPQCRRQTLKSFLVLPFQRITRLKLLLENIMKMTDPGSCYTDNLTKAIQAIHELVSDCDHGVQRMKQTEELVRLGKQVDFGNIKSIPLITQGRYLIHEGALKRLNIGGSPTVRSPSNFSNVYLHLFNDLLLVSSRKGRQYSVQDYALFPSNVSLECVRTDMLGLPAESFLLRLIRNHTGAPTAFILATRTRDEKEAWVQALSSQRESQTSTVLSRTPKVM